MAVKPLVRHDADGVTFGHRRFDRMANASELVRGFNAIHGTKKRLNDWLRLPRTYEYGALIAGRNSVGIPTLFATRLDHLKAWGIVRTKKGPGGAVWVHEEQFVRLAAWLSPEFERAVISCFLVQANSMSEGERRAGAELARLLHHAPPEDRCKTILGPMVAWRREHMRIWGKQIYHQTWWIKSLYSRMDGSGLLLEAMLERAPQREADHDHRRQLELYQMLRPDGQFAGTMQAAATLRLLQDFKPQEHGGPRAWWSVLDRVFPTDPSAKRVLIEMPRRPDSAGLFDDLLLEDDE